MHTPIPFSDCPAIERRIGDAVRSLRLVQVQLELARVRDDDAGDDGANHPATETEGNAMNQQKLATLHADSIDLTALAGLLAQELVHYRHVDERDRGKPDVGAVATLLASRLAVLRDNLETAADGAARE